MDSARQYFTNLAGQGCTNLVRLNPDGMLDAGFNPDPSVVGGNVVAVQPDGKVLVDGFFTNLAGHACFNIGRLNPDGTLQSNPRRAKLLL